MQSNILFVTRSMGYAAVIAAGLFMSGVPLPAFAGETVNGFVDQAQVQAEAQAHETWRENVRQFAPVEEGCHHASYPNMKWEKVECGAKSSYRSAPRKIKHGDEKIFGRATPSSAQVDGNGTDYSIQAPSGSLISTAVGSFPSVTGVTSEKGVGVAAYNYSGNLGPNQYTLQLNTNMPQFPAGTSLCGGSAEGCITWQQYIVTSDDPNSGTLSGTTDTFIQTWIFNYGVHRNGNACPKGFNYDAPDSTSFGGSGNDCYGNSPSVVIAKQLPITALASLKLSGSATANGTDTVITTYGTNAYSSSVKDSVSNIASGWTQAEFNVVGNAGGSQAAFNTGSSVTTKIAITDGSTAAPTCVGPSSGTTGESNNLTLGTCTASAGSSTTSPSIQFVQSN
ncbi:hypothetical protein [Collimonas humicola]|uniref:hypothetical protein n=1 Tax=Collimonas humicola TaxID=2825886 RepID=UPI001E3AAC5F|nr:hypothetical protein [Collimonas humicola]